MPSVPLPVCFRPSCILFLFAMIPSTGCTSRSSSLLRVVDDLTDRPIRYGNFDFRSAVTGPLGFEGNVLHVTPVDRYVVEVEWEGSHSREVTVCARGYEDRTVELLDGGCATVRLRKPRRSESRAGRTRIRGPVRL